MARGITQDSYRIPLTTTSKSDPFENKDVGDKDWRNAFFEQFIMPYLQMQMDSTKSFLPYQSQMQNWLGQTMGITPQTNPGMGGNQQGQQGSTNYKPAPGGQSALPSWLMPQDTSIGGITGELGIPDAPDWTKPFTPEQIATYMDTGMTNLQSSMNDIRGNINSDLTRRGLRGLGTTSSADTSMMAGLDAFNRFQQAQLKSGLLDKTIGRGDQLRGEATNRGTTLAGLQQNRIGNNQQNFWSMYQAANPQYGSGQPNSYTGLLQKSGGGGGSNNSWLGDLGTIAGFFL